MYLPNRKDNLDIWHRFYTYRVFVGHRPVLLTSDADVIQEVCVKKFQCFRNRAVRDDCVNYWYVSIQRNSRVKVNTSIWFHWVQYHVISMQQFIPLKHVIRCFLFWFMWIWSSGNRNKKTVLACYIIYIFSFIINTFFFLTV